MLLCVLETFVDGHNKVFVFVDGVAGVVSVAVGGGYAVAAVVGVAAFAEV